MPTDMWLKTASAKNQWPKKEQSLISKEQSELFKSTMLDYYDACTRTSARIMHDLCVGLGTDPEYMTAMHSHCDHTLELKYYPPYSEGNGERLMDHADLSSVTLLVQDSKGGLQVYDESHARWLDAPARPDAVLCNTGDFMELWTDGRLSSTRHRVVAETVENSSQTEGRISIVFFCTPNYSASTRILPELRSGKEFVSDDYEFCGDKIPFVC
eukprot:252136_1